MLVCTACCAVCAALAPKLARGPHLMQPHAPCTVSQKVLPESTLNSRALLVVPSLPFGKHPGPSRVAPSAERRPRVEESNPMLVVSGHHSRQNGVKGESHWRGRRRGSPPRRKSVASSCRVGRCDWCNSPPGRWSGRRWSCSFGNRRLFRYWRWRRLWCCRGRLRSVVPKIRFGRRWLGRVRIEDRNNRRRSGNRNRCRSRRHWT